MSIIRWSAIAAILIASAARADIAPMPHPGYTLAPRQETRVRMAGERVDIVVGERPDQRYYTHMATVTASFDMVNDTPDTVSLEVGFPVEALFVAHGDWAVKELVAGEPSMPPDADEIMAREADERWNDLGYFRFQVSIDGGAEFAPDARKEQGILRKGAYGPHYLWFYWDTDFPPGATRVDVSYRIPTVYSKRSSYQNLGYILQSGANWAGTIGAAAIVVHFPETAPPVHPAGKTTPGFKRTDYTISWEFEDLEPGPQDDIAIEFISPDAARAIRDLSARLDTHPDDVGTMVELARTYLDVVPIADDCPERPDFASTTRSLLENALEIDPTYCLAWKTYLAWEHGLQAGRFGFDFLRLDEITERQTDLAERAHDACPDDPGVEIWYDLLTPQRWVLPDELGVLRILENEQFYWLTKTHRGGASFNIEPKDLKIIEACYMSEPPDGMYRTLVLRDRVADDSRRALLALLGMYRYFQRTGIEQIERYYRQLALDRPLALTRPVVRPPDEARALVEERMTEILAAFDSNDLGAIARVIHPEKGVRVSLGMYMTDEDPWFSGGRVAEAADDTTRVLAGYEDGSGFEVWKTVSELLTIERIPTREVGYNRIIGTGNTPNNLLEYFPGCIVVEYHDPGSEERGSVDWYSRMFVLDSYGGEWYVVGIAEGYWTI